LVGLESDCGFSILRDRVVIGGAPQMENDANDSSAILEILDGEFANLIVSLRNLTKSVPPDLLYRHPPAVSVGEHILKSARAIEQTFGGLTVNLWDDPFEWTLPEALSNADRITEYLDEVDQAERRAFASFESDATLTKLVSTPSGEARLLLSVLLETLVLAADYRGRAVNTFKILSNKSRTGFII
jgi:hypothetical protein